MKVEMDELTVNGKVYIPKDSVTNNMLVVNTDGLEYVIVRTYSAGVFAGYLKSRNGKEVVMNNAICLWQWAGAASLLQLAVDGVSKPDNCKFTVPVKEILLLEAIEIIPVTEKAFNSINGVKSWKK